MPNTGGQDPASLATAVAGIAGAIILPFTWLWSRVTGINRRLDGRLNTLQQSVQDHREYVAKEHPTILGMHEALKPINEGIRDIKESIKNMEQREREYLKERK